MIEREEEGGEVNTNVLYGIIDIALCVRMTAIRRSGIDIFHIT